MTVLDIFDELELMTVLKGSSNQAHQVFEGQVLRNSLKFLKVLSNRFHPQVQEPNPNLNLNPSLSSPLNLIGTFLFYSSYLYYTSLASDRMTLNLNSI